MTAGIEELDALFRRHRKALTWKAFKIVSCRETAEDLVSEAYTRIIGVINQRPIAHVSAFLYQTVHNLAIDHLRQERTRRHVMDADEAGSGRLEVASLDATPEKRMADRERLTHLTQALSDLPHRARMALILSRMHGLSYPQIAKRLGVSESTVYKDIRLAMSRCLDAVGEE